MIALHVSSNVLSAVLLGLFGHLLHATSNCNLATVFVDILLKYVNLFAIESGVDEISLLAVDSFCANANRSTSPIFTLFDFDLACRVTGGRNDHDSMSLGKVVFSREQ